MDRQQSKPNAHLGLRITHLLLLWIHFGLLVGVIVLGALSVITVAFIVECVLAGVALLWILPATICSIWDNGSAWSQIGLDIFYVVLQLIGQLFVAIWITLSRIDTDCYGYYSWYSSRYWQEQDYEMAVCNRLVAAYVISYVHAAALFIAMIALIVLARRRINAGWGRGVWKMSTARLLKIKKATPPAKESAVLYPHLPPPPPQAGLYTSPMMQMPSPMAIQHTQSPHNSLSPTQLAHSNGYGESTISPARSDIGAESGGRPLPAVPQ